MVSAPVVALNVAEIAFAGIVMEDGTVNAETLSVSATVVLTEDALESVTVQEVPAFEPRLVAAHCSDEIVRERIRERVSVFEEPFNDAVIVAV